VCFVACSDNPVITPDKLQLVSAKIGQVSLSATEKVMVSQGEDIVLTFNKSIDPNTTSDISIEENMSNFGVEANLST